MQAYLNPAFIFYAPLLYILKCFFGNNLKIKIDNITFDLPKNKISFKIEST